MASLSSSDEAQETPERYREEEAALYKKVQKQLSGYLVGMPFLPSQIDFKTSMPKLITGFRGEFCFSTSYDPEFVAELMYNGFLTMAMTAGGLEIVTPKLHTERSLIMLDDMLKPHGSTLKKSKKFELTVDTHFAKTAEGIQEQHGYSCWFYPNLTKVLTKMNAKSETGWFGGRVRVHSFEVWTKNHTLPPGTPYVMEDGYALVAGECGYSVGQVYTSLSGFTRMDAAGTVQMYAMASHLKRLGFKVWDLGMQLGYKHREFGAVQHPRAEFIRILSEYRDSPVQVPIRMDVRVPCKDLVNELRVSGKAREASDHGAMEADD